MFAVDITIALLHWVPFEENVITRASDIPTDIKALTSIFAGVEVQAHSGLVKGVFKTITRRTFKKISTILISLRGYEITTSGCVQRRSKVSITQKVGWMVDTHPTYINDTQAVDELMDRLHHETTLELTPHRLVWPRGGIRPLIFRCIKVTTSREEALASLDHIMTGLSHTPEKYKHNPTANWKFVPFEGGEFLPPKAIDHLILRQNKFLHEYNSSVCIDNLQYIDKQMDLVDNNGEPYKMSIRE